MCSRVSAVRLRSSVGASVPAANCYSPNTHPLVYCQYANPPHFHHVDSRCIGCCRGPGSGGIVRSVHPTRGVGGLLYRHGPSTNAGSLRGTGRTSSTGSVDAVGQRRDHRERGRDDTASGNKCSQGGHNRHRGCDRAVPDSPTIDCLSAACANATIRHRALPRPTLFGGVGR